MVALLGWWGRVLGILGALLGMWAIMSSCARLTPAEASTLSTMESLVVQMQVDCACEGAELDRLLDLTTVLASSLRTETGWRSLGEGILDAAR